MGGVSHRDVAGTLLWAREGESGTTDGATKVGGGGDPAWLYKYNGNLLHLCTFARLNMSQAAEISAGGKFLSACRNGKSAGGKSFWHHFREFIT